MAYLLDTYNNSFNEFFFTYLGTKRAGKFDTEGPFFTHTRESRMWLWTKFHGPFAKKFWGNGQKPLKFKFSPIILIKDLIKEIRSHQLKMLLEEPLVQYSCAHSCQISERWDENWGSLLGGIWKKRLMDGRTDRRCSASDKLCWLCQQQS